MQVTANDNNKVVVGLGVTGVSCARYLASKGQAFSIVDSRDNPPALSEFKKEFPNVPVNLGEISDESLNNASLLVVSPGVSLEEPAIARAIKKGVSVCGDIDLFRAEITAPLVAITGSNGKSTVTTLVGAMAKKAGMNVAIGGNLGLPALDLLQVNNPELFVLELSSFQLERAGKLHVDVATVLNLSADHMDRYGSYSAYCEAKHKIFLDCKQIVINRGDPLSKPQSAVPVTDKTVIWSYGLDQPPANGFGLIGGDGEQESLAFNSQKLMPVSELKLVGRHNIENALAALALGHAIGIEMQAMLQALREFSGLDHRCQFVRSVNAVDYFNDSKGTNVGAVVASILGLSNSKGKIVLVAGGESKSADFSALLPVVKDNVRAVVLIGQATDELDRVLGGVVAIEKANTMSAAVAMTQEVAKAGDRVLLSPACASFDMFDNYQHRGNAFCEAVRKLSSVEAGL